VDAHRFAFVFGSLPSSVAFQRRALGNGARVASAQARALAGAALFEARSVAVRSLLCDVLDFARPDVFEELTMKLFGAPLPGALCGAWPAARGDEWTRLQALLTSVPMLRELVGHFDVDWFANPRASQYLRARASAPARDPGDAAAIDAPAAAVDLARSFEEALG
jgi:hypothetical protein